MIKYIALAVASCALIAPVHSAEWSVTGSINPSTQYNDNLLLSEEETSSFQNSVSPTAVFTREQDDNNASLSLGYVIDRFTSLSYLDAQRPFIRFNSGVQNDRSSWGLAASYVENSSRNLAAGDTGNFTTESTVSTETISPSYSYKLTERDNLSVSGSYTQRTFSTADFSDNEVLSINTAWKHQFTERFNGGLNISVSNFQATSLTGSETITDDDSYNVSGSINYDYSEIWKIGGKVGMRMLNSQQTNNFGLTETNSSSGLALDINAIRNTELDTMSFAVSRNLVPSSVGEVNEVDRISFSWSRQLTETMSASLSSNYLQTTSAINENREKRENLDFSPAINWQFARNLGINLAYSYRQQKQSVLNTDISSNSLSLSLNYNWDGLRASR